jgi:hypothetical protein
MKWETTDAMLESAKKYAADFDDKAVKSEEYDLYGYNQGLADLLRAMSKEIERLDELEALS